jgi:hypothetical protein
MARSPSALDRLKALDEERSQLMAEAKQQAMDRVNAAVKNLNSLGFNFRVSEGGRGRGSGSRTGTRQVNAERPCPICGFRTNPPHDARAHRSQGDKKKAFTAEELSAKGMQKA